MKKRMDYPMLILTLSMVIIGLIMLFSASYARSLSEIGDPYRYVKKQAIFAVMGVVAMYIISKIDYHIYHRFAWLAYGGSVFLLFMVAVAGTAHGGAQRWLSIPGVGFEFQPSELAKTAIIILFSSLVVKNQKKMNTFKDGMLPFLLLIAGVVAFTALFQSHLSATTIIAATGMIIIFVGGANFKWLFLMGAGAVSCAVLYIVSNNYTMARIKVWFDPFIDEMGTGFQAAQSFIAIGSGGLFGLGFGQSRQKYMFLPEPENDFIFPVICEELGFVGAMAIILLFAMFIFRGFMVGAKAKDKFGTLLCVGIMSKVSIQIIMNLFVVTGAMPVTGVSLPFFSYGGTALIIQICEIGILLNISRQSRK